MTRCQAPHCEGWQVAQEDRYCSNCGTSLRLLQLQVEMQKDPEGPWIQCPVLGRQPVRLRLRNASQLVTEGELRLPSWIECNCSHVSLAAREEQTVELTVSTQLAGLTPLAEIGWNEASLLVCYAPSARVQLEWIPAWIAPESQDAWIEGRLLVLEGAVWLGNLPDWIDGTVPSGGILNARGPQGWDFRYHWQGQQREWELFPDLVLTLDPAVRQAGWLVAPALCRWPLRAGASSHLVSLQARGFPVLIEAAESSHRQIEVELPSEISPEHPASLRLSFVGEWPKEDQRCQLQLRLSDGRTHRLDVDLTCPQLQEFAGWLLLDLGSSASSAALLWEDGRLESLRLTPQSAFLPSGLRYHPDGTIEATAEQGDDVIWQAKRYLGLSHPLARVQIGDGFKDLNAFQVVRDTFQTIFQALFEVDGLADFTFPRIALCHPVGFSPRQVAELERALRAAGAVSAQIVTMSEPLAAAFHHLSTSGLSMPSQVWRLFCLDFGALTSDVALLRVDSRDRARVTVELEAVGGDRWFGGWDITRWLAENLPAELQHQAEEMKCSGRAPSQLLAELEEKVKARMPMSLPRRGDLAPDKILLTGRGAAFPAVEDFLRQRFPGVLIERSRQPKECVVLGAARHPELARSLGPRYFGPQGTYLQLPERPECPVYSVRLGLKILGQQGAEFYPMVEPGTPMGENATGGEISRISLQVGSNPIEILENLGWEDALVGPDGQPNPQVVSLQRLDLWIEGSLHPAQTRLCWQLSSDYQLYLSVYHQGQRVAQAGPVALW